MSPILLQDTIDVFSTIKEVTTSLISHILPHMLCYFVMAVLAITPQTRTIRIALFPVMVLLALRAAVPVDMSLKITEQKFHHYLAPWIFVTTTRALGWALARKPLVRQCRPLNSSPSTLMDAFDLICNLRGCGWDWSRGVHFPRETRPSNRTGFILHTILSAAANAFASGILNTAIRSSSSTSFGIPSSGPTIFDESLPFCLRFLRSSIISALAMVCARAVIQMCYDLCTILGVVVFRQDSTQWPPLFDAPWCSTSVTYFFGRRWHPLFRKIFLVLGGYPLSFILGRAGVMIGAFFISAVFHHIILLMFNNRSEFWRMLVSLEMGAMGILIEDMFKYVTGREVQGLAGWVWTMGWLLLLSNVIIDGCVRAGAFGLRTPIDMVPPVRMLAEYLVTEFDNFLHAISNVPVA